MKKATTVDSDKSKSEKRTNWIKLAVGENLYGVATAVERDVETDYGKANHVTIVKYPSKEKGVMRWPKRLPIPTLSKFMHVGKIDEYNFEYEECESDAEAEDMKKIAKSDVPF